MKQRTLRSLGSAFAILITALGLSTLPCRGADQPVAPKTVLNIATSSDEVLAAVLYARKAGYFDAAGLDVRVEKQNSGAAIAAAVTSGTYDLGTSSIVSLMNARRNGLLFMLVAPGAAYDDKAPISELLTLKDSPIRSARDLNGKVVAIQSLSDLDTIATRAWVDGHGGDSKTIQFVEMPMAAKAGALQSRRVDAAIVGQPFLAQALASGQTRVLAPALTAIAPRFTQSAWFGTNQWVGAHADTVRKFRQAMERADAYVNKHHAEVASDLAAFLHLQSAELHGFLGTTLTPADVQPVIDVSLKYHQIEQPIDARSLLAP